MKKRMLAVALVFSVCMAFSLCSCGEEEKSDASNPVRECESSDEINRATGLDIDAPKGAEDVSYSYISVSDDEEGKIAQVIFSLDGQEYCYRCQKTEKTGFSDDDVMASLEEWTAVGEEISGMQYDWKGGGKTSVSGLDAVFAVNEGKEGFISWIDGVPGVLYSLSVEDGADDEILVKVAEKSFVSMQGSV